RTAIRPSGRRRATASEATGLAAAGGPVTGPEGDTPGPSGAGQDGPGALPRTPWTQPPRAATPAAAADPASLNHLTGTSGWAPVPVDRRTVWTGGPIANTPGVPGAPGPGNAGLGAPGPGTPGPGASEHNAPGHGIPLYGTPGSDPLGQTAPRPSPAGAP